MDTTTGRNLSFVNTSNLQGYPIEWFEWDFGDGNKDSTNWDTVYAYSVPGTYNAKLTVTTECGTCTPFTETINVTGEETVGVDWTPVIAGLMIAGAALIVTQR